MGKFYCQYVPGEADDSGTEALYLYFPTAPGYIQYSLVHSVIPSKQCDTWRLGTLYYCDRDFHRTVRLTRERAEWEMAIRLHGRPDFIGGAAHGDEVYEAISLRVDGRDRTLASLSALSEVSSVGADISSVGFDPSEPTCPVLRHEKQLLFLYDRLCVDQRVIWLSGLPLERSYLAMMPPLKTVTDRYRFGEVGFRPINERSIKGQGEAHELVLCGKDGFVFSMTAERYPYEQGKRSFIITDNGGDQYHKMYFVVPHRDYVTSGEIWESRSVYRVAYAPRALG